MLSSGRCAFAASLSLRERDSPLRRPLETRDKLDIVERIQICHDHILEILYSLLSVVAYLASLKYPKCCRVGLQYHMK